MLDQMLMDRFRIVKQIGFGAFGETFLAEDTHKRLGNQASSQCVVKRLITQTDPTHIAITRQMFEREASKLDDLNHWGIPKLIAYFEDNGQFYLVQEFIDGHPLSDEINHTVKWSEARTRGLLREVLEILAYVHSQGSIHRDLKPSNIMRRRANDKIVLIDFGAVREVQQNQTNMAVGLASGTIAIGTLGYMPAEQTQGRPCFASDIYAVGCMAIEALTAEAPYGHGFEQDAETGEFRWRHKAQVSDDFVEYIDKMVRYDFRQRYRNAEQALTSLQSLKPIDPPPTTIIVTQQDVALPSPNESKTVEPTQVTTPQPDLSSTEILASPTDPPSSSTIITASEPNPESTASTIVSNPDVQHEASTVELEQAIEATQLLESPQKDQAPTEPIPNLSTPPTIPTTENSFLATETAKPVASHQLINSNYGYQPPKNIDVKQTPSQQNQDLPTEVDPKKRKALIGISFMGLILFLIHVVNLQNTGSSQYSSSTYTAPTPTSTLTPTPTSTPTASKNKSRGYIGIQMIALDAEIRKQVNQDPSLGFQVSEDKGILVTRVEKNSPADKGGFKAGDIITKVDGQEILNISQFTQLIGDSNIGYKMRLQVKRNGQPVNVEVEIAQLPAAYEISLEKVAGEYTVVLDPKTLADAEKEGVKSVTGKWIIKSEGTFEATLKAVSTKDEVQEIKTAGKITIEDGKVLSQVELVNGEKPAQAPPKQPYTLSADGKVLQADGQPVKLVKK